MEKEKPRNSNIELFRIIAMWLIVAHHYVVNSGLLANESPLVENIISFKSLFLLVLGAWGKTGINCFVLISGFFMCKANITLNKFLKLLGIIMFYRISIAVLFWVTGYHLLSIKDFLLLLIPVKNISTGFAESYLVFFLAIPFLNVLIRNMIEKQHLLAIILGLFIYVFLGTIPLFHVTMNYVSWFIVLYLIASYIRIYPKEWYGNSRLWISLLLCFVLIGILTIIYGAWKISIGNGRPVYAYVSDSNTVLALVIAICAFISFKNLCIKQSTIINNIAKTTFGVLLIHAGNDVMREWLWRETLKPVDMYYSKHYIIYTLTSICVVFIVCSLVESFRLVFIEKPVFKIWNDNWPLLKK